MTRHSRLRFVTDVSAADWVVARVGRFGSGVGGLVPHGFEAYARVLHPAWEAGDRPVTWATVAAWSGRVVHPRVQFEAIASPAEAAAARPWQNAPYTGTLPPNLLSALCDVLASHTRTPEHCWFCVWDGYTRTPGPDAVFTATKPGEPADEAADSRVLPPRFPPGTASLPEVVLPERPYLLLDGPLDAAGELAMTSYDQSPSLLWPDDRAWFVATDVDLDSTYLGGSAALVRDLLADARLEAVEAIVTDPVWADSDDINR
jgi:hypothetical protein